MRPFKNRGEASTRLATRLAQVKWDENTLILGLPRGGVPMAVEVARQLQLPWAPFQVKKITAPDNPEYAIGAMVKDGTPIWNERAVKTLELHELDQQALAQKTNQRMRALYSRWPELEQLIVEDKTVILVDDGLATGLTMQAAVISLRDQKARRIIIAVPVAARSSINTFSTQAVEVIVLETPEPFYSVGQWYEDFSQVTDAQVEKLVSTIAKVRKRAS